MSAIKHKLSKSSKAKRKENCFRISISKQALIWPILMVVALFLAQSLKMPLTYMTFIFTLFLPLIPMIYLFLSSIFIRIYSKAQTAVTEKNTPFECLSIISNHSIIPFPFIEAQLMLPDDKGVKSKEYRAFFTLAPLDSCEIRKSIEFAFRGEYEIGLSRICVTDPFKMARLTIECEHKISVTILPRRFELPQKSEQAESELTTQSSMKSNGADLTEATDIRSYTAGDSMKSIHWKLSSKAEELVVKNYSQTIGDSINIICDLETHFSNKNSMFEPIDEYCDIYDNILTDLVIENALAAALRELRRSNRVRLLWISKSRSKAMSYSFDIKDINDFEQGFKALARAAVSNEEHQAVKLTSQIKDISDSSLIMVTPSIMPSAAEEYIHIASLNHKLGTKGIELIYVTADDFRKPNIQAASTESKQLAVLSGYMTITRRSSSK